MTLQEVFNNALFGVRKQKYVRSYDGERDCMYRGPNDCRCHIGHNIRDEDYKPEFEGYSVEHDQIAALFPGIKSNILFGLQQIHDRELKTSAKRYETMMLRFAKAFDLEYKKP
jgi:hypothetical protein